MREEPARRWQAEPRCFERSGTLCRGDCYLTWETAELRNRKPTRHAAAPPSRRAGGASQPPAGVTARAPAGKKRKRAEIWKSGYRARSVILQGDGEREG